MPLNDLTCKNAKPKAKPYKLNDGEGLWFFVNPNGKKYWRFKYRFNNKENMLSFGAYPHVSITQARSERDNAKSDLANGLNPASIRHEQKLLASYNQLQTFENVSREWHTTYINNWSAKQAARILRRLEAELFQTIGHYEINKLSRKVLLTCLKKAATRSPELGKRLLGYCKQIFEFAGLTERVDKDLTIGIKAALPKYMTGHFAAIELEQLPDFIEALFAQTPIQSKLANQATKLALLFACRTMELLNAERAEFNLDNAVWIVKSARMKKSAEQRKMKRDHLVPLSKQAIKILMELDEEYGKNRKYLLPSPMYSNQPVCKNTILDELDRIGYKSVMTAHGFRTVFTGVSTEKLKFRDCIPDRQLGHVPKGEVMRVYDRAKYLDERTELMQRYADYFDGLLNSNTSTNERKINDRSKQSYGYQPKYATAYRTTFAFTGGAQNFGQYQHFNAQQPDQIRGSSKAPEAWTLQRMDNGANTKPD